MYAAPLQLSNLAGGQRDPSLRRLPSLLSSRRTPCRSQTAHATSMLLRSSPRRLHLLRPHHLRLLSAAALAAQALPQSPTDWAEAPLASVRPATADSSLFHVSLDLSAHRGLLASHAAAGQFLPFRLPAAPYPIFLAIASPPPSPLVESSSFDFLVKRLPGTPSARLCDLRPGDLVHVGASVVGRGFEVARITDARDVLIFATGSGISPIRSLIESGIGENGNIGVNLFYGVRNLQRMAYQERFSDWESRGIKIIPVLSRPDAQWTGERGYVQNVFSRMKKVVDPSSMGAILCGHKQMTEEITRVLVADGLSKDKILTNF
ncbi:fruit protein pKIWI502-like isoform X2 [Phragmites australis]|uniref:fruit protein pKIWI502-like isoform X2 n=1 Tax=Phragmites australis TaxID=29695 RepID=UPI002D77D89E|nr:fruit protein pKIWI502-like isoform X2 [Phragmites australis]